MYFGNNIGYGTPFYLNGKIFGWVCMSLNGTFKYTLAKYLSISEDTFQNEHTCRLALMKIVGE